MAEWPSVALSEVAELTVGHVGPMATEYVASGVPFLRSQNVLPMRLDLGDVKYVSRRFHEQLSKSALHPGDVVIVRTGRPGACAVIPSDIPIANCADLVVIRCGPYLNPRFLSYYVNALAGAHVTAYTVGAVQQHFNVGAAKVMQVPLPPLDVQQRIAGVLGALDDKIELNRRLGETLEAMSRALFRSWFVGFDPVRSRAAGRDPGLPADVADLFASSFEGSEFGEIPSGWRLSNLGDEADTRLGGTPSRERPEYWGGDIPWINSGKANEFRIVEPSEFITQAGLAASATKPLPARTTVIAITGATLGQVSITEIDTCANQSIVGVVGSAALPSEYIYGWVTENIGRLVSSQTGGAQQHINKNDVNELPVVCPPAQVVSAFVATAAPMFDRIREACFESRTLASLRNTLLPKLVSGEVRVPQAAPLLESLST